MRTNLETPLNDHRFPVLQECSNCKCMARARRRDFSSQAWTVLLFWNEIGKEAVDQAICDECYGDLRDILIDRADEILEAVNGAQVEMNKPTSVGRRVNSKKKAPAKKRTSTKKVA